jgi:asparagine synthase (glutamine-hydrolysing)
MNMCGIAGIVANSGVNIGANIGQGPGGNPDSLAAVRGMTGTMRHRGPDGEGYAFIPPPPSPPGRPGVALGHRRLAILDLSPAGAQPMRSHDGRFTIALNGEIFNYRELRAELGGPFHSGADTEVLLEACAAWGVEKTLDRANGMFAFALWDRREQELTLARDRSGEKPLVYFWDGVTFAFASELKALAGLHSSRLDPAAVDAYLALGYVPAPLAIFRDCRKLPPGHLLRFRGSSPETQRWWFPEKAPPSSERPQADRAAELRWLIADAVRLRLRADVPVALSLSGGVDSSVIAAECAAQGASLDSFTVVFDGDQTDLPHARSVARHLNLRHHLIEVPVPSADPAWQLDLASAHYDEPFADSSALPSLALASALAGRYRVILNGDGGDEAFAGYPHYERIAAKQFLKAAAAAVGLADGSGGIGVYVQSKAVFRLGERAQLLAAHAPGSTLAEFLASDGYLRTAPPGGALRRALWSDRHLHLANDLTYKTDIALAAFGMEGRSPFLDHRIIEWAQGLDPKDLVRGREKKVLLRQAYRDVLPASVLARAKHGFGAPIAGWLAGPFKELLHEALPCPLLDAPAQRKMSEQRLWTLLAFARWAQRWGARW